MKLTFRPQAAVPLAGLAPVRLANRRCPHPPRPLLPGPDRPPRQAPGRPVHATAALIPAVTGYARYDTASDHYGIGVTIAPDAADTSVLFRGSFQCPPRVPDTPCPPGQ